MVDYIPVTNTEVNCVMLYLMASLDDHKGPDDKEAHNGAKKFCSKRQPCDVLTWSKAKNPECTEKLGFCPSNSPPNVLCPSANLLINREPLKDIVPDGGLEWRY